MGTHRSTTNYQKKEEGRRKKEEGRRGVLSYHCDCVPGQKSKLKIPYQLPITNCGQIQEILCLPIAVLQSAKF
ncbi:MAG: hypothetical protein HC849_07685 [Oscillatoriales cyanobacterium RU_3_3]|nr:hypothetical protein [Oscillatoriales cyanobacterium RU_3_3]